MKGLLCFLRTCLGWPEIFVAKSSHSQGRINHKGDEVKSLGPMKKGLQCLNKIDERPTQVKMKTKDLKKFGSQKIKKCLGPARALTRP